LSHFSLYFFSDEELNSGRSCSGSSDQDIQDQVNPCRKDPCRKDPSKNYSEPKDPDIKLDRIQPRKEFFRTLLTSESEVEAEEKETEMEIKVGY
jgi:hypothetical protein